MSGKFTDVMNAAKDAKQKEYKDDRKQASSDAIVNVCIKVPLSVRKRWTIEATTREVSLKDLVVEAVEEYLAE